MSQIQFISQIAFWLKRLSVIRRFLSFWVIFTSVMYIAEALGLRYRRRRPSENGLSDFSGLWYPNCIEQAVRHQMLMEITGPKPRALGQQHASTATNSKGAPIRPQLPGKGPLGGPQEWSCERSLTRSSSSPGWAGSGSGCGGRPQRSRRLTAASCVP